MPHRLSGKFIVLDGPDGSGKSTVLRRVAGSLTESGLAVVTCKDPGGTAVGDRIRSVLLDHDLTDMDPRAETLLFMASRAQLVAQVVRPALEAGSVVLCDRFVSSTCAYQIAAGDDFDAIISLARHAIGDTWPDLTLILDVPPEVGFSRIATRGASQPASQAEIDSVDQADASRAQASQNGDNLDGMERRPREFHQRVRDNFLALAGRYPTPIEIVSAIGPVDVVASEVLARLDNLR